MVFTLNWLDMLELRSALYFVLFKPLSAKAGSDSLIIEPNEYTRAKIFFFISGFNNGLATVEELAGKSSFILFSRCIVL